MGYSEKEMNHEDKLKLYATYTLPMKDRITSDVTSR